MFFTSGDGRLRDRETGFHNSVDRRAKSLPGAEQPGSGHRKCVSWSHCGISRAWRRMADTEDSYFVDAATNEQMRARTNWGILLPPADEPQPPVPGLPSPANWAHDPSPAMVRMSALGHVWTAPWQELSDVAAALVGCGHVSGLLVRRGWPLALMLCADRVPIVSTHFEVR